MTKCLEFWAMTWNADDADNLPDVDTLIGFLNERRWRFVFQTEKVSRRHYQGRIKVDERRCKTTLLGLMEAGGFDVTQLTLLPESNNSVKKDGLDFYVTKVTSRIDGPWMDATYQPPVQRVVYKGEDLECMQNPTPWQAQLVAMTTNKPCERTVHWIFNASGNAGKSKLQKWLCWSEGAKRIPLGTATQIKTAVVGVGPRRIYVVNIPRVTGNQESQRDLFSALEEVKDGWVSSNMYGKDQELFMVPPHLFIFSNDLPDLTLASADRWKIWYVADLNADCVPYVGMFSNKRPRDDLHQGTHTASSNHSPVQ